MPEPHAPAIEPVRKSIVVRRTPEQARRNSDGGRVTVFEQRFQEACA